MIRTLRITSIAVALLAGLFFIFPVVFGLEGDERIEQTLDSPGAVEMYLESVGRQGKGGVETSPLVKQAETFAKYLNPPAPPRPKAQIPITPQVTVPRPREVEARFRLLGTSVHPTEPQLSLALIEEPAKGTRWVRQSGKIGHLMIEQVEDGTVVVRDGERTFELVAERADKKSLVKTQAGGTEAPASGEQSVAAAPMHDERSPAVVPTPGVEARSAAAGPAPGGAQVLDRLATDVRAMAARIEQQAGDKIEDRGDSSQGPEALMQQLLKSVQAMRVSSEEARNLDRLGRRLDEQAVGGLERPGDSKIEIPGGDPNHSGDSDVEREGHDPNEAGNSDSEKGSEQE